MNDLKQIDLSIDSLGAANFPSPLGLSTREDDELADFTEDKSTIPYDICKPSSGPFFELAGPRALNFFRGSDINVGIVSSGGLCPGMNNVIRTIVTQLWHHYACRKIYGFRYGLLGMIPNTPYPPIPLTPEEVSGIQLSGGTILGSSRGPQDEKLIVEQLRAMSIDVVFFIGGDGSMRAAKVLYEEICRQKLKISVVGVPKTIDNDLPFIEKTFGFDTAVSIAKEAIQAAHVEATGAVNGVGLVRLMGRHSGFIAASATLASGEVNLVLVPELSFSLHGSKGVIAWLKQRLMSRGHAVVVVAEGAGQQHVPASLTTDKSGNKKLANIGTFLAETFDKELADIQAVIKYIDPSYLIRAQPPNAADAIFCGRLAEEAVHAAMAGKTGMVVGLWYNQFTHVPLHAVTRERNVIDLDGTFWRSVVDATGQPHIMR